MTRLFRRAIAAGLVAVAVAAPAFAGSAFRPCFRELLATRVTVIDTQLAPVLCITHSMADYPADAALILFMTLLGLPVAACAVGTSSGATIIAPIGPGLGHLVGALSLHTPDELLGHELAHVAGMRHPALFPFIELECQ